MNNEATDKLLDTLNTNVTHLANGVDALTHKVTTLEAQMGTLIRLEERQINQKEALARVGKHIDRHDDDIAELYGKVNSLRVAASVSATKLSFIAAGAGIVGAAAITIVFEFIILKGG